jgi:proteasome lid subunit RPN8/RPN11
MLRISIAEYEAIRRHGEESYPHECCGILIGAREADSRTVKSVIRCRNRSDSARNDYHIDPRELIQAQREARDRGLEIVGFYHSHPDHPPRWSPTDLEQALWIGCSYVITSVEGRRATLTNSFVLSGSLEEEKALVEEEIVLLSDANC